MKIIFECNEKEARDMLALKQQFDNYQENTEEAEIEVPEKRKIGF